MNIVQRLVKEVATARAQYIDIISRVSETDALWRPHPDAWNITDITEHLFWAEHGGIVGMWKTLHAIRKGTLERRYASVHENMPIEEVIAMTWQPKEKVPEVAAPRMGGPLSFWRISLNGLQETLNAFGNDLQEDELRVQAHPHPISGAMDFQQRLEFLRFHINRHQDQVSHLLDALKANG